jgi:hypothetical protein
MTPYWNFIDPDTGKEIVREMTEEEYAELLASHAGEIVNETLTAD